MNCEFNNFSGSENLAARSIIKFDLNYTPAGVDAGVPDGIIVKNMYFLGSYGVSAIVLVDGSTSAATESRIGKIKIENLLLGCITTIDFDNRAQSTGRHGAIILNKASLHYSELSFVFGGVKTIQLLNNSKMLNTIIKTASNELQDQQSSGERGLIYSDATSYFEACSFESLRIYAIGVNFAPTYNYHMIDATLYNCDIITPYIYENAQDYGLVPADFIKVLSASYGNRIDHIEYFGLVNTTGDRSDISQTFITAPATSSIGSFTPPYSAEVKGLTVSPGNTVLFTIPADIIELRDTYDIRVVLSATACTVRVFASISIFLESETTTFTVTENILEITGTLFMDSATSKAIVATAAMKSVYRSTDSAGSYLAPLISGTYTVGNEVKVYVGIAGATDVEVLYASITGKRGKFSTEN